MPCSGFALRFTLHSDVGAHLHTRRRHMPLP